MLKLLRTPKTKSKGVITLVLARSETFNIMQETIAHVIMTGLSNMYEKPYVGNKVFLISELFMTRNTKDKKARDNYSDIQYYARNNT